MDTLRILVATDNHLGYCERDPVRADDSFRTFDEILRIAASERVDAVLLAGDLFHENRPSRKTLHRTMETLRHHCMGSAPVAVQLLSEPTAVFAGAFGTANWEDPNYNVALPVLAIHGNHDDPAGDGNLSALDVLAAAGLINYFGRTNSVDDIRIAPVLLRKGRTQLALYGLGAVRDERLHRAFVRGKVQLLRPPADAGGDAPASLLVLHQNRAAHTATAYIPESFLADASLDAVIWGHEHECLVCAETGRWDSATLAPPGPAGSSSLRIIQPGSSVATSLSPGEVRRKHVVVLNITGRDIAAVPVPLTTVRPMVLRDVSLRTLGVREPRTVRAVEDALAAIVDDMLRVATESAPPDAPSPPLIRLRVDCTDAGDSCVPNAPRFGLRYAGRIANTRDILHMVTRRVRRAPASSGERPAHAPAAAAPLSVEDMVVSLLGAAASPPMLLAQNEFCDTLRACVARDDREAMGVFVRAAVQRVVDGQAQHTRVLDREAVLSAFAHARSAREDQWRRLHGQEAGCADVGAQKTLPATEQDCTAVCIDDEVPHAAIAPSQSGGRKRRAIV